MVKMGKEKVGIGMVGKIIKITVNENKAKGYSVLSEGYRID